MTLAPGAKLGPYEILSPIGAGGMGEVWKARDTRLGRIVAIKQVKEQHSERFKQEARSIAALNHPYICQLHDIGPDYLVLEYVEGKPLSSPLPEKEAVRLAIQIATALEEAHQKGIIHRDLKPSNIMVTDKGSVKLLDFGLAKLYEQDASGSTLPTADFPATQAGAVLGTVAYMSPEQAQGQAADARSDIFSFGLVLYEMLSGKRAFSGDSNFAVMNAIVKEEPPQLKTSPSLEKIIRRCLAKQPSGRYQTMSEVKTALEKILEEMQSKSSTEPQPSIAVLPFVNMSGDKEQEYFSDGLAEEIINALTQIPGLKVIARTSAFAFKDKHEDIRRIAEVLGVNNILEGSVRKSGNRIRVTAQLITAADGSHLWSERYDREMADIFAIQDEIAQSIAKALRVKLSTEPTALQRYTPNLPAYEAYLRGQYHRPGFTPASEARSKECYKQAIELDPKFALAHIGYADHIARLASVGLLPAAEAMPMVRAEAQKALDIDSSLPDAHAMLGIVAAIYDYDWKEAEGRFRLAMAHDAVPPLVRGWYGYFYLLRIGRLREALEEHENTLKEDPLNLVSRLQLAICLIAVNREAEADDECRKILELDDNHWLTHLVLGISQIEQGKFEDAIPFLEKAYSIAPWFRGGMGMLAGVLARTGDVNRAEVLLQKLRPGDDFGSPNGFAYFYYTCGELDSALDWAEKVIEQRDFWAGFIPVLMKDLRFHSRWPTLARLMNLPEEAR